MSFFSYYFYINIGFEIIKIGFLPKEKQFGRMAEDWEEVCKDLNHEIFDVSNFIQELLLVKDQEETV